MKPVTLDTIKKDLRTAAYVERLMPPVRPPRYRCCMPEIVYTPQEIAFMDRRPVPPRPTQWQVMVWEKVILQWMPLLDVDERKLVWKRASRIPWKFLCREFGLSRNRLMGKHDKALIKIHFYIKGTKKCPGQKKGGHFSQKSL